MPVAIAGLWDLGYNVPLSEAPLWLHPIRDFGVDEWHMSPVTGIAEPRVTEWADPEAMVDSLRDRFNLVFVSEDGEEELLEFIHPGTCCYVFGKSNWSPFVNLRSEADFSVRLDTKTGLRLSLASSVLFPVLWHRRTQWR